MTEQMELGLYVNHCPQWVIEKIDWAQCRNGELVIRVRGCYGLGAWLRENLEIKATNLDGEYVHIKAIAPPWVKELAAKNWQGPSGSQHPANYIAWHPSAAAALAGVRREAP